MDALSSRIAGMSAADPCKVRELAAEKGGSALDELLKSLPAASCPGISFNRGAAPVLGAVAPKIAARMAAEAKAS